jgi:hypothetical protein
MTTERGPPPAEKLQAIGRFTNIEENTVTENGNWIEEYPAHDLWRIEKNLTPLPDEEQLAKWEQAVEVLRDLGPLAATLNNDPLLLALTDAMDRAEEERERLKDRLSRPEGEQLHPREHERLMGLMVRSDTFGTAEWLMRKYAEDVNTRGGAVGDELAIMEAAAEEANEHFDLYRAEVGIPDPPQRRGGARQPA